MDKAKLESIYCLPTGNDKQTQLRYRLTKDLIKKEIFDAYPQLCRYAIDNIFVEAGWIPLVVSTLKALNEVAKANPSMFVSVKEIKAHNGELVFSVQLRVEDLEPYVSDEDDELRNKHVRDVSDTVFLLIQASENKALTICEYCGQPGARRNDMDTYWVRTTCETHKL